MFVVQFLVFSVLCSVFSFHYSGFNAQHPVSSLKSLVFIVESSVCVQYAV